MPDIPPSDWTRINDHADRFERAWKQHAKPRIEDFLAESEEANQTKLFEELLKVELELRRDDGEAPTASEYQRRFPDHATLIKVVFAGRGSLAATGDWSEEVRPPATSPLTIPPELANNPDYNIIRPLGRGGMGAVFLAHNEIMGREEVLKVISPEIIDSPAPSNVSCARSALSPAFSIPTSLPRIPRSAPARAWSSPWNTSMASTWRAWSKPRGRCRSAAPARSFIRRRWACSTPMRRGLCIATSSRATSCSPTTGAGHSSRCSTSGWPRPAANNMLPMDARGASQPRRRGRDLTRG